MINGINIGQSYSDSTLQDIGNDKGNDIEIFGNHFRKGKITVHIWNDEINIWFVFDRYEQNKGSIYKCVYKE